ncbi:MAG: hypothetical protein QOF89_145 [Acidobacteriota bacterium]|nr:hypothetical protein [Acidobacteriota bacterium]
MNAVEWKFDSPDLNGIRQTIRSRLATQTDTRLLPAGDFLDRLIVRVLEASIQKEPGDRTLTRKDLSDLLDTARSDIGAWAASPMAERIRAVFDEVGQIKRLLRDNIDPLPPNASPGKLLTAAYEVIPFDEPGRHEELAGLATWCTGAAPRRRVLLLTGEGGSGKTRLMIEWCRRLRHQGWHAGFLRRDRGEKELDPLLEGSAPRLVVVDYAETRLEVVRPLLLKMALAPPGEGPPLRLVLLARREADWWHSLPRQDREIGDLLGNPPDSRTITPLVPKNMEERRKSFLAAVARFALQQGRRVPSKLKAPDDLQARDFDRALYLHMAALAALEGKRIETAEDALRETLDHERRFWERQASDQIKDASLEADLNEALASSVTALTLVGGAADSHHAQDLLQRVLKPFPLAPHHPGALLRLLRILYGASTEANSRLEPLQPDLLGEELVAATLPGDVDLLGRVLDNGSPEESSSVLTVLTRLARRRPDEEKWLETGLKGRLEQLAEIALNVAVETGDPMGPILAREIEGSEAIDVVIRVQKFCDDVKYQQSVPLREVARIATEKSYTLLRERKSNLDEDQLAEYSRLASNLGVRLRDLGRREEALQATGEAVEIRRQLALQRPDAFRPDLATSLNNLGLMLSDLGRREEALQATQEAVEIYRQLALQRPDAFRPVLATSLNNLGNMLSDLGRREEALQATQEAVEIRRQLAQQRPDAFRPNLAISLNNLGTMLSELGRREEALQATQEAVEIYRQLALQRPDAFRPYLATSLNNLGNRLSELGREEAFSATEEAVQALSPYFLGFPAAFAAWMTIMVRNYLKYAEASGAEPDQPLLAPIREVLESMSASEEPAP